MGVHGLKGMQSLRTLPTPEEHDKKLKEVSSMYEKQFLREMVKAMRGTVQESGLIKVNQAEKIFREQLDSEYVDKWSDKGGIGLADLIHQQLVEKYGAQLGLKGHIAKPKGPIAIGENSNYAGFNGRAIQAAAESGKKVTYRFDRALANAELQQPGLGSGLGSNALKAPWDGVLTGSRKLGSDEFLVEMTHDNGLKSQFVFRGLPNSVTAGGSVQAGQTIGILSPEAKSFFWTLEHGPQGVSE
jgi:flagellar protein FlgJ